MEENIPVEEKKIEKLLFRDTEQKLVESAVACLQDSGVASARYEVSEDCFEIYVLQDEFEKGKEILLQLLEKEADRLSRRIQGEKAQKQLEIYEEMEEHKESGYKTPKQKLEDVKSSAFSFLLVGGLGAALLILEALGVFSIGLEGSAYIAFYITMGGIFAVFLVVGILNACAISKWKQRTAQEEETMKNVREFVHHDLMDLFPSAAYQKEAEDGEQKETSGEDENRFAEAEPAEDGAEENGSAEAEPAEDGAEENDSAEDESSDEGNTYFEREHMVRLKLLEEFPDLPVYLLEEATEEAMKLL